MSEKPDLTPEGIAKRQAARQKSGHGRLVVVTLLALGVAGFLLLSQGNHLTGKFVRFVPVNRDLGQAVFTVENTSTNTETAACKVHIVGAYGTGDVTSHLDVAGQTTITARIEVFVDNHSAYSFESGTVTDC